MKTKIDLIYQYLIRFRRTNNFLIVLSIVTFLLFYMSMAVTIWHNIAVILVTLPFMIGFPLFVISGIVAIALPIALSIYILIEWEEYEPTEEDKKKGSLISYNVFKFFKHLYNERLVSIINDFKKFEKEQNKPKE